MEAYLGKSFKILQRRCALGFIPPDMPDDLLASLIGNATVCNRACRWHFALYEIWRRNRIGGFTKTHLRAITVGSFDMWCIDVMLSFCDRIVKQRAMRDVQLRWPENRESAFLSTMLLLGEIIYSPLFDNHSSYVLYRKLDDFKFAHRLRDQLAANINMSIADTLANSRWYPGRGVVTSHEMLPELWFWPGFLKSFELRELTADWGRGTIAAKAAIVNNKTVVRKLMGIADASDKFCFAKELARLHAADEHKGRENCTWIVEIVPDVVMLLQKFGCCAVDLIKYTGYVEDLYVYVVRDYLDGFPDELNGILVTIMMWKTSVRCAPFWSRVGDLVKSYPDSARRKKMEDICSR